MGRKKLGRRGRVSLYVHSTTPLVPPPREERKTVSVGDEIKVLIEDVNRRGEGIATYEGRTVIVRGAADPGEVVLARVKKVSGGTIIAEAV